MGFKEEKIAELEEKKQLLLNMIKANKTQTRRQLSDAEKINLGEELIQLQKDYGDCVANIERFRRGEPLQIPPERLRSDLVNALHRKMPSIDLTMLKAHSGSCSNSSKTAMVRSSSFKRVSIVWERYIFIVCGNC